MSYPVPPVSNCASSSAPGAVAPSAPVDALPAQALRDLSASLSRAKSPAEAVRGHLAVAQDLSLATAAFVSTFDPSQGLLAVTAVRGRRSDRMIAAKPGVGPIGQAYSTGQRAADDGHLAIPISSGGQSLAVLSVLGARAELSAEMWDALAAHLAACLGAAQAQDAAVRRIRDLETAVAGLRSMERALDGFLGSVAHELRSPLTTLKGYLTMAERGTLGPLTSRQQQAMQASTRSVDRLSRLTSEMLLMTRLKSGRMTLDHRPFGLKVLVEEALARMAKVASSAGVSLVLRPASEVFVRGDRERLLDVLVHLLDRAVGHRRASNEVVLTLATLDGAAVLTLTESSARPSASGSTREPMGASGPAGPERIRSPESELGPSLPRHIARLHGGNVRVQRGPGEGETVILSLPLFAGAVGPARPVPSAAPGEGILLVEDDDDCREVVKQLLESEGFSVTAVRDCAEAVAALAASLPAMVLLDLGLGDGDGRAVLRHIRSDDRLSRIPVFVVSGRSESAAGFEYDGPERIDGFFEKPLNLPRVMAAIRRVVGPPED